MARISSAADFPAKHIEMVSEGSGNFKCKSQSASDIWYNLSFGDEKTMPRCSCPDFSHTGLLCRHFFAVFNYYPQWQWTSLPGQYTEHPNISLDGNSISTHTNSNVLNDISNVETNLEHGINVLEKGQNLQNISVLRIKKEAKTCREILKQLTDMTYNIENATALSETSNALKLLLNNLSKHQTFDDEKENNPIPCDSAQVKTPVDTRLNVQTKTKYLPLSLRPKKKKYSSRVGQFASMMQKHYQVDVALPAENENSRGKTNKLKFDVGKKRKKMQEHKQRDPSSKKMKLVTTPACNVNGKASCKSPTLSDNAKFVISSLQGDDTPKLNPSDILSPDTNRMVFDESLSHDGEVMSKANLDDDVIITSVTTSTGQITKRLKRTIDQEELSVISNDKMLTDMSINCAQNILHETFPSIAGLEETTIGSKLLFTAHKQEFVQILHDGNLHWVCVSNIGCRKGEINYYDSLYCERIKPHVQKQIATLLHEELDHIKIHIKASQQQSNRVDCGVFAISSATNLLYGKDPSKVNIRESLMRGHLASCLLSGVISPFPEESEKTVSRCCEHTKIIWLYCLCRLPWFEEDNTVQSLRMAQCDRCDEWFHQGCAKIKEEIFMRKNQWWICTKCLP